MTDRTWRLGALVVAVLVAAGCGSAATGQGPAASGQVVIKASEWKFEASSAQLPAGKPLTLTLQNQGKLEHNVKIVGLSAEGKEIELDSQAGQTASIKFTAEKAGTYQFVCTLPGHQQAGMRGQLVVVAP